MHDDDAPPSTPLALMLVLMRQKWLAGDREGAAGLARAAAPYLHAKRASMRGNDDARVEPNRLSDAELAERLAGRAAGTEGGTETPS